MNADNRCPAASTAASAIAGDRSAMQLLWQENRRWIAAVLLAHKPASADLEDLLQEVAMTLVAKINTLRDETNLRAWLRTIAVNTARAAARTGRTRDAVIKVADPDHIDARGAVSATADDSAQQVLKAAACLPEHYREPLMLRAVHGLRTREIAEILDIEEAAVDTRISRARRMLREALEQVEGGEPGDRPKPSLRAATGNGQLSHHRLEVQP